MPGGLRPDPCPEGFTLENLPVVESRRQLSPPPGPGTELKKLLSSMGITESTGCQCRAVAALMNSLGPEGCLDQISNLVRHLTVQAEKHQWLRFAPFKSTGAELLVRQAIARARAIS